MVDFNFYKAPTPPQPDYGAVAQATGQANERQLRALQFLTSTLTDLARQKNTADISKQRNATDLTIERERSASQEKIHQQAIDAAKEIQKQKADQDAAAREGMMMVLKAQTQGFEQPQVYGPQQAGAPQSRFAPMKDLAQDPAFHDVLNRMHPQDAQQVIRMGQERQGEIQAQRRQQQLDEIQGYANQQVDWHLKRGNLSDDEAANLRMSIAQNPVQGHKEMLSKLAENADHARLDDATKMLEKRATEEPQNAEAIQNTIYGLQFSGLSGTPLQSAIRVALSKNYTDAKAEKAKAADAQNTQYRDAAVSLMDRALSDVADPKQREHLQFVRDATAKMPSPTQALTKQMVDTFDKFARPKPATAHEPTTENAAEIKAMREGTPEQATQAARMHARRELIHVNPTAFLDENGKPFIDQAKLEAKLAPIVDANAKELLKLHRGGGGGAQSSGEVSTDEVRAFRDDLRARHVPEAEIPDRLRAKFPSYFK